MMDRHAEDVFNEVERHENTFLYFQSTHSSLESPPFRYVHFGHLGRHPVHHMSPPHPRSHQFLTFSSWFVCQGPTNSSFLFSEDERRNGIYPGFTPSITVLYKRFGGFLRRLPPSHHVPNGSEKVSEKFQGFPKPFQRQFLAESSPTQGPTQGPTHPTTSHPYTWPEVRFRVLTDPHVPRSPRFLTPTYLRS